MDLGSRIAAWRKSRGLSQAQLADAVGVSVAAVYQWEGTGESKTKPSADNLEKIAAAFGLSMEKFYGDPPDRAAPRSATKQRRAKAAS